MDARERLRVYLEQRREMGEVDLVLDTMSVEDVLKLVGGVSKSVPDVLRAPSNVSRSQATRIPPDSPITPPADLPRGIIVGKPTALGFDDIARLPSLEAIADAVRRCTRCSLHLTAKNPVPGEGHPQARFVCVGEAPGATEDETGRPFVGAAGQLLTKILAAIDLPREDVFSSNCRTRYGLHAVISFDSWS